MQKSGIIYPNPKNIHPEIKTTLSTEGRAGSRSQKVCFEDETSKNDVIRTIVMDDRLSEINDGKVVPGVDIENFNQITMHPDGNSSDVSEENNAIINTYYKEGVNNHVTNNITVDSSSFDINTFRNTRRQDSEKRVLESLQKNPDQSSNENSRKFSSGNNSPSGGNRKDKGLTNGKNRHNDSANDSARDLLTVNQISSKYHSSVNDDNSNTKEGRGNDDTVRDLLTVGQIKSRKDGNNLDYKKEIKKLNKRRVRIRKRSSEKSNKSDGPLMNLMFIFEIFRWFSGSDIIVRFIIGAIAGIAGFGIIFTSMGLLDNL